MVRVGEQGLRYDEVVHHVEQALNLPAYLFANDPELRGPALEETRRALRSVLAYLPNSYFSNKLISYSVREQIGDFMPGLMLSGAVAGVVYLAVSVSTLPALMELIVFSIVATTLYLLCAYALKLQALTQILQIIKERRNKK